MNEKNELIFSGNETQAVTFTAELEGEFYECGIRYNINAQRWYFLVNSAPFTPIVYTPLISSSQKDFNLLSGVFKAAKIFWYERDRILRIIN